MSRQDECTKTCVCCYSIDQVRRDLVKEEFRTKSLEDNYATLRREYSMFVQAAIAAFEESMASLRAAVEGVPADEASERKTVQCPACKEPTTILLDGSCVNCAVVINCPTPPVPVPLPAHSELLVLLEYAEREHVEMHSRTLICFCEVRECRLVTHLRATLTALDAATARVAALEAAARAAMEHDQWEALHTLLASAPGEENG